MVRNQKGFTLIELVMVIVILGLLAAVAVPKYQDLRTDARDAAADGVYGAANGATAINFAARLLNPTSASPIRTIAQLVAAMEETPQGWEVNGSSLRMINETTIQIGLSVLEAPATASSFPTQKATLRKAGW